MPKTSKPPPPRNKILAALPSKEYQRLLPHLTPISLEMGKTLYGTEDNIRHVYFPNSGVVSLVTHMEEGMSVEVGFREGLEEFVCECYEVVKAEFDRLFSGEK